LVLAKERIVADPSRHADVRNALESLVRKIPGFKGYLEKEDRRDSDQLARALIVEQLKKCKASLDRFQRTLVDAGQIDALPRYDSVRSRLDLLQSRVQGAMRGYSGFFDFVRVDEALLDQVYQHDLSIVDDAQALAGAVEQLGMNPGEAERTLKQVETQLTGLGSQLDERTKLLEGLN
jgi:hypothetical protein